MRSQPEVSTFQMLSAQQMQAMRANAEAGQPEAQFLLSQICHQNKDLDGMIHWLGKAAGNGIRDALDMLGQCHEKGMGMPRDFDAAMTHYDKAVEAGSCPAAYHKAELLYKSQHGTASKSLICDLLVVAAESGFVPALRATGYLAMQQASSKHLAINCFRRAAQRGDPVSSFNLGWCLLQGWGGDDEQGEAVQCLQRAVAAKYPIAETLLATVRGAQPAPHVQVSEEKIEFGASFSIYPDSQSVDHQIVSSDPPITLFKEVLNIVDCAYLMFLSQPHLKRADVIDPDSERGGMVSDVRTSMSTYIPFDVVDIISRYVELKIIRETGEDLLASEPMSILRYSPGQYYRPHVDYFDPNLTVSEELMQDGGQRRASAVTYLAAPSAGGGTSFPNLKLTVPASAGSTLWFRNCFDDGQIDERSLHAGDAVEQGEKWVVTKWFRESPTRYLAY